MRKLSFLVIISMFMIMIPQIAGANGVRPSSHYTYYGKQPAPIKVTLVPGSLKANVIHIAHQYGWQRVVWDSQYDYHWASYTKIKRSQLRDVLNMILVDYPLQAIFYKGNHILVIQPRNVR